MRLGAHMSIKGGFKNAIDRGEQINCDSIQIFTKSNRSWKTKPISEDEREIFLKKKQNTSISPIFIHATYLINIASRDAEKFEKSVSGLIEELSRAEQLELPWVVLHPGSHLGAGLKKGIERVIEGLDKVHQKTEYFKVKILLENVAGQGTNIGRNFKELKAIIDGVASPDRLGVCFDTCHAFAGGHDLRTEKAYNKTMAQFDSILGLENLLAFHLNDSVGDFDARKDRHAHIGKGKLGLDAFKFLVNDNRFKDHPGVLETPKSEDMTEDIENLKVLRSLIDK